MDKEAEFRLDYMILPYIKNRGILIFKFNIPFDLMETKLEPVIREIISLFGNEVNKISPNFTKVRVSISSTYWIKHSITDEIRLFKGSFNAHSPIPLLRDFTSLIYPYQLNLEIKKALEPNNIEEKLIKPYSEKDTAWRFLKFHSIVLNMNIKVIKNRNSAPYFRKRKTIFMNVN